jgi:ribonuclease HI
MQFTIFADGGARGNPGPAGSGAMIRDELGNPVATVSKFLGHQTNNFAEYEAVILAFEEIAKLVPKAEHKNTNVVVKMDSMLVVKQVRGEWKVKHPNIKPQHARLRALIDMFGNVSFAHIYRKDNADADALANVAMDGGMN